MASIQSVCILVVCCVMAVSQVWVMGHPTGTSDEKATTNGPITISPDKVEPPSNVSDRFGFRCPSAQTDEEYRMTCAIYIDDKCGCVYDDMHVDQFLCISGNETHYEEMVQWQLELEKERDEANFRKEGVSSGERYHKVLDCLTAIPRITALLALESRTQHLDISGGDETTKESNGG